MPQRPFIPSRVQASHSPAARMAKQAARAQVAAPANQVSALGLSNVQTALQTGIPRGIAQTPAQLAAAAAGSAANQASQSAANLAGSGYGGGGGGGDMGDGSDDSGSPYDSLEQDMGPSTDLSGLGGDGTEQSTPTPAPLGEGPSDVPSNDLTQDISGFDSENTPMPGDGSGY